MEQKILKPVISSLLIKSDVSIKAKKSLNI